MEQPKGLAVRALVMFTFAFLVLGIAAAAGGAGTSAGEVPGAARRAACGPDYPRCLVSQLPAADRLERHRAVRLAGVPQIEAETLLATAEAAAYLIDTGDLLLLGGVPTSGRLSVWRPIGLAGESAVESEPVEDLGERSVEEFLGEVADRFPNLDSGAWGKYLVKVPRVESRGQAVMPATRAPQDITSGVVLSEGFESVPWARWQPSDNTNGQYGWGPTTCVAHSGSGSADGIRGGTVGGTLSCSGGYPLNLESWLDDTQCEDFQGASTARLDMYVWLDMEGGSDDFAVFYPGSDQNYYGLGFSGNTGGWVHLIFDLRHWYKLGDLATSPCNHLSLLFESDESGVVGSGVRVDDVGIVAGPASGLSCSASASTVSGPAPLNVGFTGTVTGASGSASYSWSFGDGGTATAQNPNHTYSSPGDYNARFRVADGNDTCYSYLVVHVTTGGGGAQPQPGTYAGTTSQGKDLEFDVNASGQLTRWSVGFACSNTTGNVEFLHQAGCPVTGGSFSCGDDSCPVIAANVKLMGSFGTATSASGTLNLAVRPTIGSACCQATGITWTATLQGGAALAAEVGSDATSGTVPLTVHFTGSASGGTPPYTYAWDFGDGSSASTEQNPAHTFTTAGSFLVTLTVLDAASASATATKSISVSPPVMAYRYLVPAVAHNPGVGGVLWRTNVGVVNRSSSEAALAITCHSSTGDDQETASLPAGATLEWANVMESLFGYGASTPVSGSLEIASTVPLSIAARTFTQGATGTFGQFYPALTDQDALSFGDLGILPLLKKTGTFRTNIGAINLGAVTGTVVVKLYGSTGAQVGNPTTFNLQPGQWQQATDIFTASGAGAHDIAYATAEVQTPGAKAWLYASVIDAGSGDPTTMPIAALTGAASSQWLASNAARTPMQSAPALAASDYAGYWYGQTSQHLPINMHVTGAGVVDYLTLRLNLWFGSFTCTGNAGPSSAFSLSGNSLSTTVNFPGSNISSDVVGSFSSSSAGAGTYSGFSGGFTIVCGSTWGFGTGTPLSTGNWSVAPETAPPLAVTAAADVTSGAAPLTIQFTSSPSGGTSPYAYFWDFGDDHSSWSQSPLHTYTGSGTFHATVTVSDAHNWVVTRTVDVVAQGAALTATVGSDATSGTVPLTVHFTGSASGGTPPYTYAWDFGDGSSASTEQNPAHTFTTAGSFLVTLTVLDAASASATATKSISVSPPVMAYRYLVPAVAHNPGVGGVLWRTNVGVVNRSSSEAALAITCHSSTGDDQETASLPAGATLEWANVMESLFGYGAFTPVSGSLEIASTVPLSIAARTFTQGATGTFGQFYPALTDQDALSFGDLGILPLLKKTGTFRTNIGAINLGAVTGTVVVKLYGSTGAQVGNPTTFNLQPGQWQQATDIFTASGAGAHDIAYATAEVQTPGAKAWLYASVIDAGSGDPTTVPVDVP